MLKGKNKQRGGALIGLIFVVVLVAAIYFGSSFFLKEEAPSEKSLKLLKEAQERASKYNQKVENETEEIDEINGNEESIKEEEEEVSETEEINPEEIDTDSSDWQELVRENENIKIKFHKYWYYTVNRHEAAQNGYNMIIGFGPNSDIWEELPPYNVELVIAPENMEWDYAGYMKILEDKEGKIYILRAEDEAYKDLIDSMAKTFEFIN